MAESTDLTNLSDFKQVDDSSVTSLAQLWAKKYVTSFPEEAANDQSAIQLDWTEVTSQSGRAQTAERLTQSLRYSSAQAWAKTEALLAKEVQRYRIDPDLINPWQIAEDCRSLFEQILEIYTEQTPTRQVSMLVDLNERSPFVNGTDALTVIDLPTPGKLSVVIAPAVGQVRQRYTAVDPRVLGFVSMQFHYSGQLLLDLLTPLEKVLVNSYFKVIDDHLYMPLQRAYEAAAEHSMDSPALAAVQQLLPISSEIARSICQKIANQYSTYSSYSGLLSSPFVKTSSIRDVEMFQVYLCLCVLEGSVTAVQQELFPLCVMLYPPLQVQWSLIREMLQLLDQELSDRLLPVHAAEFKVYCDSLQAMYSADILPG